MSGPRIRLFLDSNVLIAGIVNPLGVDRAILSLCAARVFRLVLAEAVRDEVQENLSLHIHSDPHLAGQIREDYRRLIASTRPEIVPYPSEGEVIAARHLIRHAADVPVLLSAMTSRTDWLLTHNTRHFSAAVARRTGPRIATPAEFLETLSRGMG